jgi:glycosyltransferase involved in cell wall biosynthesis
MRIAYDQQIFEMQRHGGISRYYTELVRNLGQRADVQATVIAPVFINQYLLRPDVRGRVRGTFFPFRFRGEARVARASNKALLPVYWAGRNFDIVHETYYSQVRRGRGRVRVVTVYDMIHELFPQDFPDSAQVTAAKHAAVRRADHVICISETTRQDAIRLLGIAPERSSVIYLGCSLDTPVAAPAPEATPAQCILYVGVRSGYKNFLVLLEAFAAAKSLPATVDLVAFGGRPFSADERRRIEELGVAGRVRQMSGSDRLLDAHYRAAIAFVYPSRYEGFGIPPLEAMAAGCPVACSDAGSIREVVGDAGAYFAPDDVQGLRAIMERLAEDRTYAADLRARGFAKIQKYSWESCAQETLRLYEQLLGTVPLMSRSASR